TAACVLAERAMSRELSGSCQVPLGGFAELAGDGLRMRGFVATPDGATLLRAERNGSAAEPEALGRAVAQDLLAQGAGEILAALAL
ncbi:MAG: hydroxymethylbilane synthase, partial [Gallionellaceae bacterium]|nr:hydroxymethylbilane synthase [Gallionellaceae bacterium]